MKVEDLVKVESSALVAAGWYQDAHGTHLLVEFHPSKAQREAGLPGSLVEYDNVTEAWWQQFLLAESKGAFFSAIKKDKAGYPFRYLRQ